MMKRLEKVKPRVSWQSGPNFCQVQQFRNEDPPAEVGPQPQEPDDDPELPPGFENYYAVKPLNVSNIPQITWKRPLKFSINDAWLVKNGEESTEKQIETLRISKVLEAIYPYRSAIPLRPAVSEVVEGEIFDDSKTPIIPDEDKDESTEESSHTADSHLEFMLMKIKEQGSMIDTDLLVKFLSDPEMVKSLMASSTASQPFTNPEQRQLSLPMLGNGKPSNESMPHRPCVGIAQEQPPPACLRIKGKKVQKQYCNYFGTLNGCRNGDNCRFIHGFIHDRFRSNMEAEVLSPKRLKYGRYKKNSG